MPKNPHRNLKDPNEDFKNLNLKGFASQDLHDSAMVSALRRLEDSKKVGSGRKPDRGLEDFNEVPATQNPFFFSFPLIWIFPLRDCLEALKINYDGHYIRILKGSTTVRPIWNLKDSVQDSERDSVSQISQYFLCDCRLMQPLMC